MEAIYEFVIRDNVFPSDQDLLNGYDTFINFLKTSGVRLSNDMKQRLVLIDETINRLRIADLMIISFGKNKKRKSKGKNKKSKRKSRGKSKKSKRKSRGKK